MAANRKRTRLDKAYQDCCTDPTNGIIAIVTNLDAIAQLNTFRGLFGPCWVSLADELFQRAEETSTKDADAHAFAENYDWVSSVVDAIADANGYQHERPSLIHLLAIVAIAATERSQLTLGHLDDRYDEDAEPAFLTRFIVSNKELLTDGSIPASNGHVSAVVNFVLKSSPVLGKAVLSFLTHMNWAVYAPDTTLPLNLQFSFASPTSLAPANFTGVRYLSSPYIGRLHVIDDLDEDPEDFDPFPERLHFESLLYLLSDLTATSRRAAFGNQLDNGANEMEVWSDALAKKFGLHEVLASDVLERVTGPILNRRYGGSYNNLLLHILHTDPEFLDFPIDNDRRSFEMSRYTAGGSYGPLEKVLASLFNDVDYGDDETYESAIRFVRDIFLTVAYYFREIGYDEQLTAVNDFNLAIPGRANKIKRIMNEMATISAESLVHNTVRMDPRNTTALERLKEWVNSAKRGLGINIFDLTTSAVLNGEPTALSPLEWIGTWSLPSVSDYVEAFRYALKKSGKPGHPRLAVMAHLWNDEARNAWAVVRQVIERNYSVSDSVEELFERRRTN